MIGKLLLRNIGVAMKKIIVASQNPVKTEAVFEAFSKGFPDEEFVVQGAKISSGVSEQPMSNAETLQGALTRMSRAKEKYPKADFWVGIEGGVQEEFGAMTSFAWVTIQNNHAIGKARSGTFFLPEAIARLIRQGIELGKADDLVFKRSNSKQSNGAIGLLTQNRMNRTELYSHAIILALIPFLQPDF